MQQTRDRRAKHALLHIRTGRRRQRYWDVVVFFWCVVYSPEQAAEKAHELVF